MADAETNYHLAATSEVVAAESIHNGGHSFVHLQHQVGAQQYDAPVVHAVNQLLPAVVHDPHSLDVTAQAAQAIAASASAYNIPTASLPDSDYAGYSVDQSNNDHYHHAAYAHHTNDASAHHHATATGIEYMAYATSTAAPGGPEQLTAAAHETTATDMTGYADAQAPAQAQVQAQVQLPQQETEQALPSESFLHQCSNSRQTMDLLLKDQKQALVDLNTAEEELSRAHENLAKAKQNKVKVDTYVNARAKTLTVDLLTENSRWNEMYKLLVEFKNEFGHCHVMRNPVRNKSIIGKNKGPKAKANLQSLGTWVGQVRLDARRPIGHPERLEPYKIIALNRLGFDWEPRENYWMDMYEQLKAYLEKSGGKMPPRFIHNQKFALGQWCDTQLDNYRKFNGGKKGAYINQEKIDMLNQIGFIWDKRGNMWRENYDRLKEFKKEYGHCNATASHNGGDKSFGTWVTKQKRKYGYWKRGERNSKEISLTDDQAALMDEIGFGESVKVDGRAIRPKPSRSTKKMKYSLLTGTIAGLVNASEEIEGKSEEQNDHEHQQSQSEPLEVDNDNGGNEKVEEDERVEDKDEYQEGGNYNANIEPSAVANSWGDSANAVSLLVDAIMNKESHAASSGPTDGTNIGACGTLPDVEN